MTDSDPSNPTERKPLQLQFLGALVEQLGAQLYPGATATIAELISNAWDADAKNVWIQIPLGRPWVEGDEVVVTDDGVGMSYEDAANQYLVVGRKRRLGPGGDRTAGGRPLHGRKGIGKLAAFGTATVLECLTVDTKGKSTSFRLDYEGIRKSHPGEAYEVEEAWGPEELLDPHDTRLEHGTRITLSGLRPRPAFNEGQFRRSLARRFAIDASEMRILVNGEEIGRFDFDLDICFPRDGTLFDDGVGICSDGWAEQTLPDGPVRWRIGFTDKPIREKEVQGVSVLARKKMVQRPFFFQSTAGAEGQLGQEYLVGEIQANWLDTGNDIDTDYIQANRDQLQLEDDRLSGFVDWGRELLKQALREWSSLRTRRVTQGLDLDNFSDLVGRLTTEERKRMDRVVRAVAAIPGIEVDEARNLVEEIVNSRGDTIVRELLEEIDSSSPDFQTQVWDVIRRFALIDARRNQTVIQARLKAIEELQRFVDEGALEVPTIHNHIKEHPWLLDPRWYLLDDEVKLSDLGIKPDKGERDGRMDYLFALGPSAPYTHDELLVVEIKRGTDATGRPRRVTAEELSKFLGYAVKAHAAQGRSSNPLRVTALMVAQQYTEDADLQRKRLETVEGVRLVFSTWDRVLQETKRLHEGWLAVTTRRAQEDEGTTDG